MFGKKDKTPAAPPVPKRIDYTFAKHRVLGDLPKEVDRLISEGYDPQGGIAVSETGVFVQAMVRHNNEIKSHELH